MLGRKLFVVKVCIGNGKILDTNTKILKSVKHDEDSRTNIKYYKLGCD